jgi:hypothetical protein
MSAQGKGHASACPGAGTQGGTLKGAIQEEIR